MIDRILTNGLIYTMDAEQPRVSALAISNDRVVAIGTDDDILDLATPGTVRENLERRTVIPGLTDAHLHWQWTARSLHEVDVFEVPSPSVAAERVAERVGKVAVGEWITGHGWSQEFWADRRFPNRADLDRVAPRNPVYLRAKSAHAVWVNSRALEVAGIDANTPDPPGGRIGRDASGEPDGILYETAGEMVFRHITHPTVTEIAEQMKEAQRLALASGLTGFHDYDGPRCFQALQLLKDAGELHLRVVKNINDPIIHHAHALGIRWGFGDDWLRIGGLKIFADGALGPRTALMVDPYDNEPENRGIRVTEKAEMQRLVSEASAAGLPSTIHAIGDQAVRDVLDVYEVVRREEAAAGIRPDQRRHRIEHVQVVHPDDVSRLASLQIIASMQPVHATSDYPMADAYWGDRSRLAYNPRVQLDQGVVVAFGSDSPIDPFDPIANIYAAVTRRRPDGDPGPDGWYPENRVSVTEAVRGFTYGAAYAAGMEQRLGQLKPGFLADLVVLNRDIFSIPVDEIIDIQIEGTMVGGRWRFGGI